MKVSLHLTEGLQNRGDYECNNPTSQTLKTLGVPTLGEDACGWEASAIRGTLYERANLQKIKV